MIIFYDPKNGNQVVALYTGNTNSKLWTDQGFVRAEVNDPELQKLVDGYSRDCTVDIVDGQVTGCTPKTNAVQPTPDPEIVARLAVQQAAKTKLISLGLSEEEVAAIVRL